MRWWIFLLPLVGCGPTDGGTKTPCPSERPAEGEIVVVEVSCRAQLLGGGEGGGADVYLANSRFRAVLRNPLAALTVPGLGGGTLVDAAPWDRPDRLHEIVPLVEGGWLDVDEASMEADGLVVSGDLRPLPDRPITASGRRTVAWRIRPDDPWLHLEGADGLWMHPDGALELADGWLFDDQVVYGHDGVLDVDLGGAIRVAGTHAVLIASPEDAWVERPGPTRHVSGTAPGASFVEVLRDTARVAIVPVVDDAFDARIPADVTSVRAIAVGRAPGVAVAPADDLALGVGPAGSIRLRFALGDAPRRPIPVTWSVVDGRTGDTRVDPDGATIATGAGVIDLVVGARPYAWPVHVRVEVPVDATVDLDVAIPDGVTPPRHQLADLSWPGSRSRTVRDTAVARTREAVGAGLAYAVTTAEDDVATTATYLDDAVWIRTDDGVTLTHPDGWTIGAWPWAANPDQAGHGAPAAWLLDPAAAFEVARGGAALDRHTRVDLAWMRAVTDPPVAFAAPPHFVALGPPGAPPFADWAPWFAWLDAGRFVLPSGDRDWLDVGPLATATRTDVDRALERGTLCAGSGPFVDLRVDTAGPGQIVPRPPAPDTDAADSDDTDVVAPPTDHAIAVWVDRGAYPLDRVTLFTEGQGEIATFPVEADDWARAGRASVGRWTIAVAWSTTSPAWAVTAPVWTRAPANGVVPGAPAAR